MTPSARLSAAIEILADIEARRRPAPDALKDWGLSHRFAGSKDRAAIASLVYDCLRRRASAAWLLGAETPRAILLGTLRLLRGLGADAIAALASGERHAPAPLTEDEAGRLRDGTLDGAPPHVAGDLPEWIVPHLAPLLGQDLVAEGEALATRAPLDLRANALKVGRDLALADLAYLSAEPTPLSPLGIRVPHGEDGRGPAIQAEPAYLRGEIEIQDEGSQLASLLAGAEPGRQVVDLCAGGGGKTLALAAAMDNRGQIYATDSDMRRLAPIHDRLARAGVRNAQIRTPRGKADPLEDLAGTADLVLVDAPCTGSGTWRRNPDAKWRLRPGSLAGRVADQTKVLDRSAALVRPGGRIVYVTCSILPEENDAAVAGLLARAPGLAVEPPSRLMAAAGLPALEGRARTTAHGLQLTPLRTGTDGFYVAAIRREA